MNYDIVGFGVAAVDAIMEVDRYPDNGGKTHILSHGTYGGGLTATALVAASKLGAKCWYGGALGDNEPSNFIRNQLRSYGVDIPDAGYYPAEYEPFSAWIFVEKSSGQRTIFSSGFAVRSPILDSESIEKALSAKVLFADSHFAGALLPLYQRARMQGVPIVADFEAIRNAEEKEAFFLIDHAILPAAFACEYASCMDIKKALSVILQEHTRQAVVVTDGENGAWFAEKSDGAIYHMPAFTVNTVDTTGCGDVFHGAYAAALAFGWDIVKRVRFASATAAIKATRKGGQSGAPFRKEVDDFLDVRR
ncbi:MAG: PfkB family carbohydrate kinase [Thermoguttaceae bacterium]